MKMHILFFGLFFTGVPAAAAQAAFTIIPLGVRGGADESNLSSYMLAAAGTDEYICLDAGTINAGLRKAVALHVLKGSTGRLLRQNIKDYLISHAHLDHIAGLLLNAPDDSDKNIYVMPYTKEVLKEKYFTPAGWANFTDEGEKPLNKYHYVSLEAGKEIPLAQTKMFVTAFPLSHGNPYQSTAFLVRSNENYILYFGDTGPDEIERSGDLHAVWELIAPLIKAKKLKAVLIECSFPDAQRDDRLFGHLTPHWLIKETDELAALTGAEYLRGLPIVITHIKPAGGHEAEIKKELAAQNHFHLNISYAVQGREMAF